MSAAIKLLDDIIADLDMRARMTGEVEDGKAVLDLSNGLLVRYYALKDAALSAQAAVPVDLHVATLDIEFERAEFKRSRNGRHRLHHIMFDVWIEAKRAALAHPVVVDASSALLSQSATRLLKAAKTYAMHYAQDEAEPEDDPSDLVCSQEQHAHAVELFAAIHEVERAAIAAQDKEGGT